MSLPNNKIEFINRFCDEYEIELIKANKFDVCSGTWIQVPFSYPRAIDLKELKKEMIFLMRFLSSLAKYHNVAPTGRLGLLNDSKLLFMEVKSA